MLADPTARVFPTSPHPILLHLLTLAPFSLFPFLCFCAGENKLLAVVLNGKEGSGGKHDKSVTCAMTTMGATKQDSFLSLSIDFPLALVLVRRIFMSFWKVGRIDYNRYFCLSHDDRNWAIFAFVKRSCTRAHLVAVSKNKTNNSNKQTTNKQTKNKMPHAQTNREILYTR